MPKNNATQKPKPDRETREAASPSATKILTVDDNEALRYSLARAFREAGYEVVEGRTGQEAIALAKEGPDLITLDVNLPDMNGYQVCQQLKANPLTAHIPVLHISATFVDPESRVKGLEGGADAYLAEPIDRAELLATVAALLRLKNAEMQARQQAEEAERARRALTELNASLEERIRERTVELEAANANLRQLSARLLQSQDEERKRIARDLHDSVGQLLSAIAMNNAAIAADASSMSPAALKALEENESLVREVLQSIRTISHLLHPPLLEEAGLPLALQWYVQEFSKRSGIEVQLECSRALQRLPADLETAIFRMVQECLGNVHRHSGSQTATIYLSAENGNVRLTVQDAGNGISPGRKKELDRNHQTGLGLRGMRERVSQFGGELEIQSDKDGTTVIAVIPVNPLRSEIQDQIA